MLAGWLSLTAELSQEAGLGCMQKVGVGVAAVNLECAAAKPTVSDVPPSLLDIWQGKGNPGKFHLLGLVSGGMW